MIRHARTWREWARRWRFDDNPRAEFPLIDQLQPVVIVDDLSGPHGLGLQASRSCYGWFRTEIPAQQGAPLEDTYQCALIQCPADCVVYVRFLDFTATSSAILTKLLFQDTTLVNFPQGGAGDPEPLESGQLRSQNQTLRAVCTMTQVRLSDQIFNDDAIVFRGSVQYNLVAMFPPKGIVLMPGQTLLMQNSTIMQSLSIRAIIEQQAAEVSRQLDTSRNRGADDL